MHICTNIPRSAFRCLGASVANGTRSPITVLVQRWSLDFVSDMLGDGCRFRM